MLLIIILIVVLLVCCLLLNNIKKTNKILIIQDTTIPNFVGNEELLQSLLQPDTTLLIKNIDTPLEAFNILKTQIDEGYTNIILQISSTMILDPVMLPYLKSLEEKNISIVASASTVEAVREEFSKVYFVLSTTSQWCNLIFYGYGSDFRVSNPSVLLTSGDEESVLAIKEVAIANNLVVIDVTGNIPITPEQLTAINNSSSLFLSSFVIDQPFLISQIPVDYSSSITFVNIPPNEETFALLPTTASIFISYPGSPLSVNIGSKWNLANQPLPNTFAHSLILQLPALINSNWGYLFNEGILLLGTTFNVSRSIGGQTTTGSTLLSTAKG